jgi:hypothetical protein
MNTNADKVTGREARCSTRALKNAVHLRAAAPHLFAKQASAEGFGTGIPIEILRGLHRLRHDSTVLNGHPHVAAFVRENRLPLPSRTPRDGLFSGTIYFVKVTFHTPGGDVVMADADMAMIVQYAQHAIIPISESAALYGPNTVSISPSPLNYAVNLAGTSYTQGDLEGWVNDIVSQNHLSSTNSCIFVVSPQGLTSDGVDSNAGYHAKANVPYIVAGVFAQNLTLADATDMYAMVVSHEIGEAVVDPAADWNVGEVGDPCDINCGNLHRAYFDDNDNYLGTNKVSPPAGFTFSYYICPVVKPDGIAHSGTDCHATEADCTYAPVIQNCQLIIDKSTFGQDEVEIQLPGSARYPAAFWVALDGFTASELGFHQPADLNNANPNPAPAVTVILDTALNSSLTTNQINTIGANLPTVNQLGPLPVIAEDPTLQQLDQRFLYPYTISFNNDAAFTALQLDEAAVLTLNATFTVGQITRSASANIELVKGQNPYYVNVNPNNPEQPSWLSFDLRFFKVSVPASQTVSRFGANMTSNAGDAPNFIASVIQNLTQNNGNVGGDSFENLSQDEDASALEFLQQDTSGSFAFNFAVARVRLLGKTMGAQAVSVRVFFRLFQAQTTGSDFNDQSTYKLASDGTLNGQKIPLMGVQNDGSGNPEYVTIPCFATERVNLNAAVSMATQTDAPNVQTINVVPNTEVDTYFGCWLDINQPQQAFLPQTPPAGNFDGPWNGLPLKSINQAITRSPHQCLIAEIRYDDTPIPAGATSGTSDKLAQRNIAWIDGPNPGDEDSRRMPHPFEIVPSSKDTNTPDELMILWGNTPNSSRAEVYLPAVSAAEIIQIADSLYSTHQLSLKDPNTIQCPVGGATFIPIPVGTARNAGLLTIDLPAGIQKGQQFNIMVRQLTEGRFTPPPIIGRGEPSAREGDSFSWRTVAGAFQFAIVIKTKQQLLVKEERLLAWLRWIFQSLALSNRWYPVWQRYIDQIGGRVSGFGGDPNKISPSPTGTIPQGAEEPPAETCGCCNTTSAAAVAIAEAFASANAFALAIVRIAIAIEIVLAIGVFVLAMAFAFAFASVAAIAIAVVIAIALAIAIIWAIVIVIALARAAAATGFHRCIMTLSVPPTASQGNPNRPVVVWETINPGRARHVRIIGSTDNGATFAPLTIDTGVVATNLPLTGSFTWKAIAQIVPGTVVLIRAVSYDAANREVCASQIRAIQVTT